MATREIHPSLEHEDQDGAEKEEKLSSIVAKRLKERSILHLLTPQEKTTPVLVHNTAKIDEKAKFGARSGPIGRNSTIQEGAIIRGSIRTNVTVEEEAIVGRLSRIGTWVADSEVQVGKIIIGREATIDNDCLIFSPAKDSISEIGQGAYLHSGVQIGEAPPKKDPGKKFKPVVIGARAIIASDTVVLPGVFIGEDAHIGAGYTIDRDVVIPSGFILPGAHPSLLEEGPKLATQAYIEQFAHASES